MWSVRTYQRCYFIRPQNLGYAVPPSSSCSSLQQVGQWCPGTWSGDHHVHVWCRMETSTSDSFQPNRTFKWKIASIAWIELDEITFNMMCSFDILTFISWCHHVHHVMSCASSDVMRILWCHVHHVMSCASCDVITCILWCHHTNLVMSSCASCDVIMCILWCHHTNLVMSLHASCDVILCHFVMSSCASCHVIKEKSFKRYLRSTLWQDYFDGNLIHHLIIEDVVHKFHRQSVVVTWINFKVKE